ncbi:hypothetical protein O6P32_06890 [Phocaeicola sp. KGMB11183]|uniref:OmpA family protein n=1 Tax=Phocaeicola acetigenes TaxID=3016083 RepID=A0ABT4PHB2_9BACT|nr:hypothetical protein [Phocaeicola sp. KGMB11183]MCZ8372436.1 hypothetical protein [Phocaeicola sp. KGMB11183]
MKQIFTAALLAATCMTATAAGQPEKEAGEQYIYTAEKGSNFFLGVSGGWGFRLSQEDIKNSTMGFGGQASYRASVFVGKWLNPFWALQFHATQSRVPHFDRTVQFVTAEALWNLSDRFTAYRPERRWRTLAGVGAGLAFNSENKERPLAFTFLVKQEYRFHPSLSLFAEARGRLTDDALFYGGDTPVTSFWELNAGITWTFKSKAYRAYSLQAYEPYIEEMNREINRMKEELIRLKAEQDSLKTEKEKDIRKDAEVKMLPSIRDNMHIEVRFPQYSFYLSETEKGNIAKVAEWMEKEKDFKICILPFSDETSDETFGENLRRKRAEAILRELTENSKVAPDKIQLIDTYKEASSRNVTDCSALIFFIPN